MPTLKFFSHYEGDEYTSAVIECPRFEPYRHADGTYEITMYSKLSGGDSVTFFVGDHHGEEGYHVCYVENAQGKTADVFRRPV